MSHWDCFLKSYPIKIAKREEDDITLALGDKSVVVKCFSPHRGTIQDVICNALPELSLIVNSKDYETYKSSSELPEEEVFQMWTNGQTLARQFLSMLGARGFHRLMFLPLEDYTQNF